MNRPQFYTPTEIGFLRSLSDSDLVRILQEFPAAEQATILRELSQAGEHDTDLARKREKRSRAAEVAIPPIADLKRREACLADPELFLRTYFSLIFFNPFVVYQQAMIRAIYERALNGGDKAVAAPRGDGKTQIAVGMLVYVLVATPIRFPVIIAATSKKARRLFGQVKSKFANRRKWPEFVADFPEICEPIKGLDGAPQRAGKQHVDGVKTEIVWTQDAIRLPHVDGSPYGGKRCGYFGLDEAIRGENDEEDRPDFAVIDDPETREVAFSPTNRHESIEEMIDGDIAGLAGPTTTVSRVVLTTIQNRRCYSWRVTDRETKPTFAGERYGVLAKWPDNRELWDEYVALRQRNQADGDKDGIGALEFYLTNREAMDAGAEITNPYRFDQRHNSDGRIVEVSALQAFFNRVADWGLAAVMAELQNDPEEEELADTIQLTPGRVQARASGLRQNDLPKVDGVQITVGVDVGKYWCHWVKTAWWGNAIGVVIDYGIIEVPGMQAKTDVKAVEQALLNALIQWRTDIIAENPPDFCLIDSGDYSDAVYEFVRQAGGSPFAASKGYAPAKFHMGKESEDRRLFDMCWAGRLPQEKLWLYHIESEHWKHWVHERFNTPTMNEANQFNDGSLSLWVDSDSKRHLTYSHHICSEMREDLFVEGRGIVRKWRQRSKNNHFLDATAYGCCAAGCLGIRVVPRVVPTRPPPVQPQTSPRITMPDGRPFLITERQ